MGVVRLAGGSLLLYSPVQITCETESKASVKAQLNNFSKEKALVGTSFPYFGVKLSCVCLLFAYRKKVMTYSDPIVTYSHLKMTYSYPYVNYSGLKVTYS